jgi:hypothetical protein
MTFKAWWRVIMSSQKCDHALKARLMNLASEDRVRKAAEFRAKISAAFAAGSSADFDAAVKALDLSMGELFSFSSGWLGLLPSTGKSWRPVTFVTARQIAKTMDETFDSAAPHLAPRVRLPRPLFGFGPPKPFLWMTDEARVDGMTPTEIALHLGLPHFIPGDAVYKLEFPAWPDRTFIPTCLDAGLYWAWCIPPRDHDDPWGLTRHLVSGDLMHPEVLVSLDDVKNDTVTAELVSVAGENRIREYRPDFLRKRTRRGIPR